MIRPPREGRPGGMARKVALWVLFAAGGVFAAVLVLGYGLTESLLRQQVRATLSAQVLQAGATVDARLGDAEGAVRELGAFLSGQSLKPQGVYPLLARTLEAYAAR